MHESEHKKNNLIHLLGMLVILVWACVFMALILENRYMLYLMPAFKPLLILGLVVFVVSFTAKFALGTSHGHDASRRAVLIRIGILVLPILFLVSSYGKTLGAFAFNKRNISSGLSSMMGALDKDKMLANLSRQSGSKESSLLDVMLNAFQGQEFEAQTVGQVLFDEKTPKGYIVIFRFVISCCVADGQPIALLVQCEDPSALKQEEWVRVKGTVKTETINGQKSTIMIPKSIDVIPEPREIYIYGFQF